MITVKQVFNKLSPTADREIQHCHGGTIQPFKTLTGAMLTMNAQTQNSSQSQRHQSIINVQELSGSSLSYAGNRRGGCLPFLFSLTVMPSICIAWNAFRASQNDFTHPGRPGWVKKGKAPLSDRAVTRRCHGHPVDVRLPFNPPDGAGRQECRDSHPCHDSCAVLASWLRPAAALPWPDG